MGNAQSGMVFRKLSKELPPVKKMEYDDNWLQQDVGMKVFTDEADREQFIYAVIAVATSNGFYNLDDHDFKLFYARREENDERLVARIVAIREGKIRAKIEPVADGADQKEAFMALRRDVEVRLDRILQGVPGGSSEAGPADAAAVRAATSTSAARDDPPAYSSDGVGMVSHGKS